MPRKKIPTVIHLLNGNPSKICGLNMKNEPTPTEYTESNAPKPPAWLDSVASKEWKRVAPMLATLRLLTPADLSALEGYCKSYSRWREAEQQMDKAKSTIMKTGKTGYLQQLPQIAISQKYLKLCKEFMTEFGMTPSSRSRMTLPSDTKLDDDMADLLAR